MHKTRDVLKNLGPSELLKYVRDSYESWRTTAVDKPLLEGTISYFSKLNEAIECNWLGKNNDAAYRQTHKKFKNYLEILELSYLGKPIDCSSAHNAMKEIETSATGLYRNWEESPLDQCIPPALKNYLHARNIFEKAAGF